MKFAVLVLVCLGAAARAAAPGDVDDFPGKPRVFVLTDMGNEPDDQMSLVRLLLYANEIDIEGIAATTSTWQRDRIQPATVIEVIAAYGEVQPALRRHSPDYPTREALSARVSSGPPRYGLDGIDPAQLSTGAAALLAAARRDDARPLWISVWGGANTLAEALKHARATSDAAALAALVAKLRVYSISDQDDAGPWIRREFPGLFYIAKPSPPDAEEYASATWTGISGDVYYRNGEGADGTTVTNEWLDTHIRSVGPLGKHYPRFDYIMEGDTPAYLNLIDNGLASVRNPSWGGWGGRYVFRQPYGEARALWTQGGDSSARVTSADAVTGTDGRTHVSDHATIWRWRRAFQHDFAARMQWTVKEFADANHAAVVVVNGIAGTAPVYLDVKVGERVMLNATGTRDPDGNALAYRWFHYAEAGFVPGQRLADVRVTGANRSRAEVSVTQACRAAWMPSDEACHGGVAHLILEVTDDGRPALSSYRRIVLRATP